MGVETCNPQKPVVSDDSDCDKTIKRPLDPKRVLQILECRRRVMNFVESMLEEDITLEAMKSGEDILCKADYDSIVQERYILKMCGFPLCSNKLSREWKQRFHVSLRDKRIYDIEIRKLFCSVKCMDRSVGYRDDNLSDQPIWMRLDDIRIGPEGIWLENKNNTKDKEIGVDLSNDNDSDQYKVTSE